MKTADTSTLYFETGPNNEPTLRVRPGERFKVITQMNAGPWLRGHPEEAELRRRLRGGNPSSGCIYIEGAKPGDMLTVHVGRITPHEVGYTRFAGRTGAMPAWFGTSALGAHEKIVKIRNGFVEWTPGLKIRAAPMLGFVGLAPERETHHNGWAGRWGGNLDMQELCAGAKLHLPVEVEGALLHVGDMHAVQGDGEICGAGGIETGGTAMLRCTLGPRPKSFSWPRIENRTHIMIAANDKPAESAFRAGLEALIRWMEDAFRFERGAAFLLLGQVLEARVTQFVNPTYTYCLKVHRRYLK